MYRLGTIVFTLLSSFLFSNPLFSQVKVLLDTSEVYKIINKNISSDWLVTDDGKQITIQHKKPVWVLFENQINAPMDLENNQKKEEQRIKKYGQKKFLTIELAYQKRWTQDQINQAKEENQRVYDDLVGFPSRLGLTKRDHKTGEFIAVTPKEKEQLKKFHLEREKYLKLIKKIPDYHVGGVSIDYKYDFYADGMSLIGPKNYQEEAFKLDTRLKEAFNQSSKKRVYGNQPIIK